jgi:hypothetical protein
MRIDETLKQEKKLSFFFLLEEEVEPLKMMHAIFLFNQAYHASTYPSNLGDKCRYNYKNDHDHDKHNGSTVSIITRLPLRPRCVTPLRIIIFDMEETMTIHRRISPSSTCSKNNALRRENDTVRHHRRSGRRGSRVPPEQTGQEDESCSKDAFDKVTTQIHHHRLR